MFLATLVTLSTLTGCSNNDKATSANIAVATPADELKEESGFASYHEQAEKVLEVLKKHLPGLLKNEEFFSNVFY